MESLRLNNIQGFVLSSYAKNFPCAAYMLLRISEAEGARTWLASIIDKVTTSENRQEGSALNIAFTSTGLRHVGLTSEDLTTFSRPFQEGMTTDDRTRILNDVDVSAPDKWKWGNKHCVVDVLLLVFASDESGLDEQLRQRNVEIENSVGISHILSLSAGRQPDAKEHFGFFDGVGQPVIEGTGRETKQFRRTGHATVIKAGEFILGYENEMGVAAPLPSTVTMPHFGADGTYLVFRQLEQNVASFWNFVDRAKAPDRLAAKMVGRWKSGAPLALYPDADPCTNPAEFNEENDFEYAEEDPDGLGCPIGSHIRRANPRDSLPPDPKTAKASVKRHRIIRRGRSYGDRIENDRLDDGKERGLHFLCLNSDIERQFEFIQQTWINNKKFSGLYDEVDPLVGAHQNKRSFSIQGEPIRTRIHGIDQFVTVRGGAYFFMPGVQALRYLSGEKYDKFIQGPDTSR